MTSLQVPVPDNSEETIRIRKYRDTLINVGRGNLLVCAWSVVKFFGRIIMDAPEMIRNTISEFGDKGIKITAAQMIILIAIMSTLIILVISLPRIIVSLSAIAEGRGRYSGLLYIPLAVILILVSMGEVIQAFYDFFSPEVTEEVSSTPPAFIIIEITSEILLIEMLIAAVRVKKYLHNEKIKKKAALTKQAASERQGS